VTSFADHFSVVDDAIGPQPWMQQRLLVSKSTPAVSKTYDPSDGVAKNEAIQNITLDWTNNSPIAQWVYGFVNRGGANVTLQTRSRAYLKTSHGVQVGAGSIVLVEASRFGGGADVGKGGLLAAGAAYSIHGLRDNSKTMPLMPGHPGHYLVAPGETIYTQVEVRFISEFWENTSIDGGDSTTEAMFLAGELQVDLFALPTVGVPPPRTIPSIVGGSANVAFDTSFNDSTTISIPADLVNGDVLVAVTATQFGDGNTVVPSINGWTLAHERKSWLLDGWGDVHLKIWTRTIVGGEPLTFTFAGSFLSEGISILFALRGAEPFDPDAGTNWFIGSNLSNWKIVEEQVAPSIERRGQFLIALSYFDHSPTQAPINQAPPTGMTELIDIPGGISTLAIAYLASPPFPTFDRQFTPTVTPVFRGHSIAAAIVVPGIQDV
jgi:hypothetical protein